MTITMKKPKCWFSNTTRNNTLIALLVLLAGCAGTRSTTVQDTDSAEKLENKVLFSVAGEPVKVNEFLYVYQKNNTNAETLGGEALAEDVKAYLDLYVNFKLKVQAAREEGIQHEEAFKKEFRGYRKQLAKPYLLETKIKQQLIEETYARMQQEVSGAHILIEVPEDAAPADTLKAYQKLDSIRQLALSGEPFEQLARNYSEGPSSKNGGNLGYFTAMQMVGPFEEAAFSTPVDSVTRPFRTRFGYHILKVYDKRPARGKIKLSHIMIRKNRGEQEALALAKDLYSQLQNGAEWDSLASQYSEDPGTKDKGGTLPYLASNNLPGSFGEQAYALENPGDISEPAESPVGWHLLKLEGKKGVAPLEEVKNKIERYVSQGARFSKVEQQVIGNLKQELGYEPNEDTYEKVMNNQVADSAEVLFTLGNRSYSVKDFAKFAGKAKLTEDQYNEFVTASVYDIQEDNLANANEDYRLLLQEYEEGMLLFEIMEDQVWSKAVKDSAGLKAYFEANRDDYGTGGSASMTVFKAPDATILNQLNTTLEEYTLPLSEENIVSLEDQFNSPEGNQLEIIQDTYTRQSLGQLLPDLNGVAFEPGMQQVKNETASYMIFVHELLENKGNQLEDIRGLVVSDYQKKLEAEWIAQLKTKYSVTINESILEQVIEQID